MNDRAMRSAVVWATLVALAGTTPALGSVSRATMVVTQPNQTADQQNLSATESDVSVVAVASGASVSLSACTLSKDGNAQDPAASSNGANAVVAVAGRGSMASVSGGSSTASGSVADALFATEEGAIFANGLTVTARGAAARAAAASNKGVVVGSSLLVQLEGAQAPVLRAEKGGLISVAKSTLNTIGADAPILSSAGDVEVDDVRGMTAKGALAQVSGGGRVLVNNAKLDSTRVEKDAGVVFEGGSSEATFQAANSTLGIKGEKGALFGVHGINATMVLVSTALNYNDEALSLLETTDGAHAAVTFINEEARGNIAAQDGSVELWLRKGSTWTGGVAEGSTATVNVCPTSAWVLTGNTTVENLNVKEGGKLVDAQGRNVSVRKGDQTLRAGNSDLVVEVTGDYSTNFEVTAANELADDLVGRGGFDNYFKTSTAFRMGFDSSGTDWTDCHCAGSGSPGAPREIPWWESAWNAVSGFFSWMLGLNR